MLNKTIAEKLTTDFAVLTTSKAFDIIVTDDIQIYTDKMKIGDKPYIPCILDVVTSFKNENEYLETFQYRLKFAVPKEYRDDFSSVVKQFRETQSEEVIDDYYVIKTSQHPTYKGEDTVSNVDYMFYDMVLNWTYSEAYTGRNVTFFIKGQDEEEYIWLPYITQQLIHDISYVSNENEGTSYRLTNDQLVIQVPLIFSNSKVLELYNSVNSDTYNAVYDVKIITGSVEVIKQVALKKGFINVSKNSGLVPLQLTFETHYPRETITLDGDTIPIVAFQGTKTKTNELDNADGEDKTYTVPTNVTRSWVIKFVKNDTDAWDKLESDYNDESLDTYYTLNINGKDYDVSATDMTEMFTDTGDIAIEVSFNEVRTD